MSQGASASRRSAPGLLLTLAACLSWPVAAANPVFRETDARGQAHYTDRPASPGSRPVPRRVAPEPGPERYLGALLRADAERAAVQRAALEHRQPRRTAILESRAGQATRNAQVDEVPPRSVRRHDPNLPAVPAPSLERDYHYNGR